MRAIKSKGTGIELSLFATAKEFWPVCRYRKHFKIHGIRCDLWFPSRKLAVFVDGDFWHGREFETKKAKYQEYWVAKIAGNMARDIRQTALLEGKGVRVMRIWGGDIAKDTGLLRAKLGEVVGKRSDM